MHISNKLFHLNSDNHKNRHNKVWCEDCNKYISDKTRHFQSGIHLRNRQNNQLNQQNNFSLDTQRTQCASGASGTQQSCPSMQSASCTQHSLVQSASGASVTQHPPVQFDNNVELSMNERTYNKLKTNPNENLEEQIENLLRAKFFPRYKF